MIDLEHVCLAGAATAGPPAGHVVTILRVTESGSAGRRKAHHRDGQYLDMVLGLVIDMGRNEITAPRRYDRNFSKDFKL